MKPTRMSEHCVITGAAGFLGTRLADVSRAAGLAPVGVDLAAVPRPDDWQRFHTGRTETLPWDRVLGDQPSVCFHLAGGASVPLSVADPFHDFESLVPGTVRLLTALARHAPNCVLVLFSSAAVYGAPAVLPVTETQAAAPVSPYGVHKWLAEEAVAHYARLFGLRTVVLRIFSAYGEGLRKQLFWDLCCKAAAAGPSGTVELAGTGDETRDFIHATDVARAALAAARQASTPGCTRLNVASGREVTVREAATTMLDALGWHTQLRFGGHVRPGEPTRWAADVSRLGALGFAPGMSLSDGLAAYARWFSSEPGGGR